MLYLDQFKENDIILVKVGTDTWKQCVYKGKVGRNTFKVVPSITTPYIMANYQPQPTELSYDNCEIAPYVYENIELIGTKRQTYKERFKKYMNKYNLKSGDLVEVYVCDNNSLTCCPKTAFSNPDITRRVNTLRNTLNEVKSVGKVVEISIDGIIYVDLRSISSNKTFNIPFPYTCVNKLIFNPNKPFDRGDNKKIFKYEDETGYILPEVAKYRNVDKFIKTNGNMSCITDKEEKEYVEANLIQDKPITIISPTNTIHTTEKELFNILSKHSSNSSNKLFEKDPYFTRKYNTQCEGILTDDGTVISKYGNDTSFNASLSIRGHLFFNSDDVTVTIDSDKVCIVDNSTSFTLIAKKNDTSPCRIKDIVLVSNDEKDWILGTLSSKNYTSSEKWIYKIKGNNNTFNYCIHFKGNEDKLNG